MGPDPKLVFWTLSVVNFTLIVGLAGFGVRALRRGDVAAHRQRFAKLHAEKHDVVESITTTARRYRQDTSSRQQQSADCAATSRVAGHR